MTMRRAHQELDAHFSSLASSRPDQSVSFLEHGLDGSSLDDVERAVIEVAEVTSLDAELWRSHPLPLLIPLCQPQ